MLSIMRQSWAIFALFALAALSSAMTIEEALHIDGIEAYLHHGYKRQAGGTGSSSAAPSSTAAQSSAQPSSEAPLSAPDTTPTPTPTPTPSDKQSSSADQASSTPASSAPQSSEAASSTPPSSTPAPSASKTSKTPVVSTSFKVQTTVEPFTTVVIQTLSDGSAQTFTSTGSKTAVVTTGQALFTDPASLSNDGSNNSGGGLSNTNKKVIGGVVGGVGGAILLGGIAIVCWRIWGRKRRVSEDDADLMAGTGSALGDKTHTSPASSPFQSSLEQYHNPGGRPNAAANF